MKGFQIPMGLSEFPNLVSGNPEEINTRTKINDRCTWNGFIHENN
jgi:hypothetical protein